MKTNKGFTLIETVIYIALLSLLLGTAFTTAFQLMQGTDTLNTKIRVEEEGNFVMRKFSWALTSLDPSISPIVGGSLPCSQTITLKKTNFSSNPIIISRNSVNNSLQIEESGVVLPITTENVKVVCLQFSIIPAIDGGPPGIAATTTINGVDFAITKYQRK